jgi:hypothetical protein
MSEGEVSIYNHELAERFCEALATTTKGIDKICAENQGFPKPAQIYYWLQTFPEFRELYTRARMRQADFLVAEAIEIADDSSQDTLQVVSKKGNVYEKENTEWTKRSEIRVKLRMWLAERYNPAQYGSKVVMEEPEKPVKITVEYEKLEDEADAE